MNPTLKLLIPLVIYPFDVLVMMGYSDEEVREELHENQSEEDVDLAMLKHDTVIGKAVLFDTNKSLIRMREIPTNPEGYKYLQHEIFHATTFILHRIGMKLKIGVSDEAYAYLVGYLTEKIYEEIEKKKTL